MLSKFTQVLTAIALATVPIVGAFACWVLYDLHTATVVVTQQAAIALQTVNRSCAPGPCGTLAETAELERRTTDLLTEAQLAVHHADAVSQTEAATLPVWNAGIAKTFQSVDAATTQATRTLAGVDTATTQATVALASVNEDVLAAKPLLSDADATLKSATATSDSVARFIQSPAIAGTATNVQSMTGDGARIAKDAADEADKLAHPNKKKLGFWGVTDATFVWLHSHVLPPLF